METEKVEILAYEMKWNSLKKGKVTKAFTSLFPDATAEIISPDHFVEFVY